MVTITAPAATHLKNSLDKRGKGIGVRLGVKTSGCSGYAYYIEYVDEEQIGDTIYSSDGAVLYIDTKSLLYLAGTEVDFVTEGVNHGLVFNNPNVKDACGCGESFNI